MNSNTAVVHLGLLDLVMNAGLVVQLVLLMLAFASVLCWAVIFSKWRLYRLAHHENQAFLNNFWKSKSLDDVLPQTEEYSYSPISLVFQSGFKELQKLSSTERNSPNDLDNVGRALSRSSASQVTALEKHLTILATTASAAPFIGLFGTVWGIMNSFRDIGLKGSANLAVVAPGISEALVATAVGLAAAIPAAIFYNHFVTKIKRLAVDMDGFSQDFLNIIQRGWTNGAKK